MKTLLTFAIALIVLMGWTVLAHGIHVDTGGGQHTGYITTVSTHGILFKTSGFYFKTDPQSSQEDYYCVPPQSTFLLTTLDDAAKKRSLVTITFSSWLLAGFSVCDGNEDYLTQISAGN